MGGACRMWRWSNTGRLTAQQTHTGVRSSGQQRCAGGSSSSCCQPAAAALRCACSSWRAGAAAAPAGGGGVAAGLRRWQQQLLPAGGGSSAALAPTSQRAAAAGSGSSSAASGQHAGAATSSAWRQLTGARVHCVAGLEAARLARSLAAYQAPVKVTCVDFCCSRARFSSGVRAGRVLCSHVMQQHAAGG